MQVEDSIRRKIDDVFAIYLDIVQNHLDTAFNSVPNKLSPVGKCTVADAVPTTT
jgi:hypothetical protein